MTNLMAAAAVCGSSDYSPACPDARSWRYNMSKKSCPLDIVSMHWLIVSTFQGSGKQRSFNLKVKQNIIWKLDKFLGYTIEFKGAAQDPVTSFGSWSSLGEDPDSKSINISDLDSSILSDFVSILMNNEIRNYLVSLGRIHGTLNNVLGRIWFLIFS